MLKDFFFFTKGERSGLIVLCCLIGLMFAVNFCLPTHSSEEKMMLQRMYADTVKNEFLARSDTSPFLVLSKTSSVEKREISKISPSNPGRSMQGDSALKPIRRFSFNYDTVRIELNSADTTELKRLRGIGSVLSSRIVKYRARLGGFSSVEQLKDVYGLSEETYNSILPHVWVK